MVVGGFMYPQSAYRGELLYESATTRVHRREAAGVFVIRKEFLGPNAARRFSNERSLLARLSGCEGVAQEALGTHRGLAALELRDDGGVALAQLLRERPFGLVASLSLATQLASILAEVHRRGVVHRDINPANILWVGAGRAALIDFDIATTTDGMGPGAAPGQLVGTLGYIAPEQTGRTGRGVDSRADLYALGATLYEVVTGKLPFEEHDTLELVHAHLVRDPVAPCSLDPAVPPGFSAIILRLLAKSPEQRYESLEQRVRARTIELQETQAKLVATARHAGKAEIANNVLHNVGNVLNSVTVSASVLRRIVGDSRAEGLARAVALMNEHAHDLPAFFGPQSRGNALLPYLNQLVDALRDERATALGDLDRLTRSVEHIAHIVITQQSHAGASSMLEAARPHDVVDEALRVAADVIERCGAKVVRRFAQVPAFLLDKPRLLQILVNVIVNGAQAMQSAPAASRRITVATAPADDGDGPCVRITVRDEGRGIAPENLTRIFAHGFTGREDGHGFGLHASAVAAVEMGARLTAHSEGLGRGAEFTVELPMPLAPATANP